MVNRANAEAFARISGNRPPLGGLIPFDTRVYVCARGENGCEKEAFGPWGALQGLFFLRFSCFVCLRGLFAEINKD